jgi:hypothetical protein
VSAAGQGSAGSNHDFSDDPCSEEPILRATRSYGASIGQDEKRKRENRRRQGPPAEPLTARNKPKKDYPEREVANGFESQLHIQHSFTFVLVGNEPVESVHAYFIGGPPET